MEEANESEQIVTKLVRALWIDGNFVDDDDDGTREPRAAWYKATIDATR